MYLKETRGCIVYYQYSYDFIFILIGYPYTTFKVFATFKKIINI